jgi:hypothetical protein
MRTRGFTFRCPAKLLGRETRASDRGGMCLRIGLGEAARSADIDRQLLRAWIILGQRARSLAPYFPHLPLNAALAPTILSLAPGLLRSHCPPRCKRLRTRTRRALLRARNWHRAWGRSGPRREWRGPFGLSLSCASGTAAACGRSPARSRR